MDIQAVKIDLIHWLTELQDISILERIQALKQDGYYELSPAQQEELDRRLEKYDRGEMKFKSWEDTKTNIRRRAKDVL